MLHVELITPEKLVVSEDADFLVAPAWDGELGVLPGHTPLLAKLGAGELRLKKGTDVRHFAISGGFLEVQEGRRVSVFAETAELAEEIDLERAKKAADRAKTKLTTPQDLTAIELAQLEAALSRAVIRLKIGGTRRRPAQPPPSSIN